MSLLTFFPITKPVYGFWALIIGFALGIFSSYKNYTYEEGISKIFYVTAWEQFFQKRKDWEKLQLFDQKIAEKCQVFIHVQKSDK